MACLGSGRVCIRGLEKLCLLGQNTQIKRKSAACLQINEIRIQPLTRTFVHSSQVSLQINLPIQLSKYLKYILIRLWWNFTSKCIYSIEQEECEKDMNFQFQVRPFLLSVWPCVWKSFIDNKQFALSPYLKNWVKFG